MLYDRKILYLKFKHYFFSISFPVFRLACISEYVIATLQALTMKKTTTRKQHFKRKPHFKRPFLFSFSFLIFCLLFSSGLCFSFPVRIVLIKNINKKKKHKFKIPSLLLHLNNIMTVWLFVLFSFLIVRFGSLPPPRPSSASGFLFPGHLAESTERAAGHDHPVITDGALWVETDRKPTKHQVTNMASVLYQDD